MIRGIVRITGDTRDDLIAALHIVASMIDGGDDHGGEAEDTRSYNFHLEEEKVNPDDCCPNCGVFDPAIRENGCDCSACGWKNDGRHEEEKDGAFSPVKGEGDEHG